MRAGVIALVSVLAAPVLTTPVMAQEGPTYLSLDAAMKGATAMATIADVYLFVARPEGGYVCGINLNDRFFPSIALGSPETAFANQPGSICVSARMFEDLTGLSKQKL